MPSTSVQMTNINNKEGITSPFTVNIEYTLLTQQGGNLNISDTSGAWIVTTPQLAVPSVNGNPANTSATLTYNFPVSPPGQLAPPPPPPITGESITVTITDSNMNVLANDNVSNITVSPAGGNPPLQITPTGGNNHNIRPNAQVAGTYNPDTNGTRVQLIVEKRLAGERRRQIVYTDAAKVTPPGPHDPPGTQGTWKHPALKEFAGDSLMALLLDESGNVLAIARATITS